MSSLLETFTRPLLHLNTVAKESFTGIPVDDGLVNSVFEHLAKVDGSSFFFLGYSRSYIINRIKYWLYGISTKPEQFIKFFSGIDNGDVLRHVNGATNLNGSDIIWLFDNNPKEMFQSIKSVYPDLDDTNGMKYCGILNNVWVLHGTNSTQQILQNGFTKGNTIGNLAYNNSKDYSGDYLFGYLLDNAPDPMFASPSDGVQLTYGTDAIVFKAATVYINHQGDFEEQAIFDRHEPKKCFLVKYLVAEDKVGAYGNWCVIGGSADKQKILYRNTNYQSALNWIERNGDNYESSMIDLPMQS